MNIHAINLKKISRKRTW